ncbi:MAG: DNA internalization-related competence protein ComEC/Rec2, partial [Gammaproteobacteria bacterium]|nr:DNA internalization-related competence protein ComEC/Rec2 [Gammaproteobacteria bacterium]
HIGLIAGIGLWLGQGLWRLTGTGSLYLAASKFGAGIGMITALVYAGLAGFAIPTQRAVVMLCVVAVALYCGRHVAALRLFAAALLAVLAYDPLAAMDPGFWLSFGAVLALALGLRSAAPVRRRVGTWLTAQFSIAIGLLPLLALLFQQASLIGPLANMLAIPVVGLIVVPLTLLSISIHALGVSDIATAGLVLASGVFERLWAILVMVSEWRFAALMLPSPTLVGFAAACAGAMWWVAARGVPARWLGLVGLVPLIAVHPPHKLSDGEYQVVLLDVGQGLSVVVHTQRSVLVYDTGASWGSGYDVGKAILIPYLQARGIDHIDTLVVSHGDNDHIGGAASLLDRYRVSSILSSVPERLSSADLCRAGQVWRRDGVEFRMLGPGAGEHLSSNDASCVLRVASGFGSVLLTGDIEARAERLLVEHHASKLRSDVLLIPHQGSKTSSTSAFLRAVVPQRALVSAGYRNRYHHPHTQVLKRYRKLAIPVHNTALSGALRLTVARRGITIVGERDERPRLWHTHQRKPG